MSTRAEREKIGPKYRDMAKLLLKEPGNEVCADCGQRDARWCSINIGCFFCTNCSGHHRGLGVHLSKVRSVDLDILTEENYLFLKSWGNLKANWYWEGKGNCSIRESTDAFIRAKYEFKRFARDGPIPNPNDIPIVPLHQIMHQKQQSNQNNSINLLDFDNMNISAKADPPKLVPVQNNFASFDFFAQNNKESKPDAPDTQKLQSNDILGLFKSETASKETIPKEVVKTEQATTSGMGFDFFNNTFKDSPPKQTSPQKDDFGAFNSPPKQTTIVNNDYNAFNSPPKQAINNDYNAFNSPPKQATIVNNDYNAFNSPPKQTTAINNDYNAFNSPPKQSTAINNDYDAFKSSPQPILNNFSNFNSPPKPVAQIDLNLNNNVQKQPSPLKQDFSFTSPPKPTSNEWTASNEWQQPAKPSSPVKEKRKSNVDFKDLQDNPWG